VAASKTVVLDASAVLALLKRERGEDIVRDYLPRSAMSVINAAECVDVLARSGAPLVRATMAIANLDIELVDCDWSIASVAAATRSTTAKSGLSLGDCICLATAQARGAPVVTADRSWRDLDLGIEIEVIR
jgi:PIN domain nuclease of toxin-antitoxin system